MIIDKNSLRPKQTYLKESGRGFKSSETEEVSQAEAT